jgi:hypothetical protein
VPRVNCNNRNYIETIDAIVGDNLSGQYRSISRNNAAQPDRPTFKEQT